MEITLEMLNKYIEDFSKQKENAAAQVHAISGAIQILETLKKQLMNHDQVN